MSVSHEVNPAIGPQGVVAPLAALGARQTFINRYERVRAVSANICAPLETEDYVIQSMDDVSPPKWHLAHTTWFFEEFLLRPHLSGYQVFHPKYGYLFNSYYEAVGARHPRPQRGLLSRPTVAEVYAYREYVDRHMRDLIHGVGAERWEEIEFLLALGFNHEQQHQELLLTDLKHILAVNPLHPLYHSPKAPLQASSPLRWLDFPGGMVEIGHTGSGFSYDNESPRHSVYLRPYQLGSRLVTNGEFLEFIEAGGYANAALWLSDGWATVQQQRWTSPFYWEKKDDGWWMMTLSGFRPVNEGEPVCHVSYFEADAYARWAGKVLPTEGAWEVAAAGAAVRGPFADAGRFHPMPAPDRPGLVQLYGDLWQWTRSAYLVACLESGVCQQRLHQVPVVLVHRGNG
jgi:ergothioneine biosynthesis protein EgtB